MDSGRVCLESVLGLSVRLPRLPPMLTRDRNPRNAFLAHLAGRCGERASGVLRTALDHVFQKVYGGLQSGPMPIPREQLQRLQEQLSAQECWLPTLRRRIAGLQDEVSAYEMMLALGRDQSLLQALEELYDRPELFARACEDPRGFFEERSVRLPDGADVTVKSVTVNREPPQYAVEARFVTETQNYGAGWSPRAGFYAISESSGFDAARDQARQ